MKNRAALISFTKTSDSNKELKTDWCITHSQLLYVPVSVGTEWNPQSVFSFTLKSLFASPVSSQLHVSSGFDVSAVCDNSTSSAEVTESLCVCQSPSHLRPPLSSRYVTAQPPVSSSGTTMNYWRQMPNPAAHSKHTGKRESHLCGCFVRTSRDTNLQMKSVWNKTWCRAVIRNKDVWSHRSMKDVQSSITISRIGRDEQSR